MKWVKFNSTNLLLATMRLRYLIIIVLLSFSVQATAQSDGDRVESVRVSFITDKVKLTPAQSAKFWPVYNQYTSELRSVRRNYQSSINKNKPNLTPEQARNEIDASLDYQQDIVDLKKKYKDRLLNIISPQQLMQLYSAEQEFKKTLVDMLRD